MPSKLFLLYDMCVILSKKIKILTNIDVGLCLHLNNIFGPRLKFQHIHADKYMDLDGAIRFAITDCSLGLNEKDI